MINIALDLASLIGIVQILGAVAYFVLSIGQVAAARSAGAGAIVILQGLLIPLVLLLSGGILFFQGWRLDPILQFQVLLMTVLVAYLIVVTWRTQV